MSLDQIEFCPVQSTGGLDELRAPERQSTRQRWPPPLSLPRGDAARRCCWALWNLTAAAAGPPTRGSPGPWAVEPALAWLVACRGSQNLCGDIGFQYTRVRIRCKCAEETIKIALMPPEM
eukprot:gene23650-biopygen19354